MYEFLFAGKYTHHHTSDCKYAHCFRSVLLYSWPVSLYGMSATPGYMICATTALIQLYSGCSHGNFQLLKRPPCARDPTISPIMNHGSSCFIAPLLMLYQWPSMWLQKPLEGAPYCEPNMPDWLVEYSVATSCPHLRTSQWTWVINKWYASGCRLFQNYHSSWHSPNDWWLPMNLYPMVFEEYHCFHGFHHSWILSHQSTVNSPYIEHDLSVNDG